MIRLATPGDIPEIVGLFKRHHSEQKFDFPFDPAQVSLDITLAMKSKDWLCLVADRSALLALSYRPPLLTVKVAVEVMLRCERPNVRKTMVSKYEEWARKQGCVMASLGTTHSYPAFQRLYRRDGYLPAEMTLSKVL